VSLDEDGGSVRDRKVSVDERTPKQRKHFVSVARARLKPCSKHEVLLPTRETYHRGVGLYTFRVRGSPLGRSRLGAPQIGQFRGYRYVPQGLAQVLPYLNTRPRYDAL
jgi:hypothetical protein